ncbi:hypothetical protein R1flu_026737 [Riccia fluitans]|uniref:Uncharacterized protein n=1 Tax=Riccia fluitans TaxID=41844 RepID=A0ABD1XGS9_9MARC
MPLCYILKNALLELEAVARCLSPVQFATWRENRDELLKWIGSTERSNSQISLSIISLQGLHLNGNCRQETTQAYASAQYEESHSEVVEICSDQGPHSSEQQPPLSMSSEGTAPAYFASPHPHDDRAIDDPRLAISAALHPSMVGNTCSNPQTGHPTAISGEFLLNERKTFGS